MIVFHILQLHQSFKKACNHDIDASHPTDTSAIQKVVIIWTITTTTSSQENGFKNCFSHTIQPNQLHVFAKACNYDIDASNPTDTSAFPKLVIICIIAAKNLVQKT